MTPVEPAQDNTILGRYQQIRTRRFETHAAKTSGMLPGWRTRSRRRVLVVALAAVFVAMAAISVVCMFAVSWLPLLWVVVTVVFLVVWTSLQIVSGRQADAPADTLDEWEVQQRNTARSIGLTISQFLVMIPAFLLIIAAAWTDTPSSDFVYGAGLLTITTLLIGGCSPAMILGWSRPDPEPEDLA